MGQEFDKIDLENRGNLKRIETFIKYYPPKTLIDKLAEYYNDYQRVHSMDKLRDFVRIPVHYRVIDFLPHSVESQISLKMGDDEIC